MGISEVKNQIVITSKLKRKKLLRTQSAGLSVRDMIRTSLQKRETKRMNKRIDKKLRKLSNNSDEELTTLIDNCTNSCPSSPSMDHRRALASSILLSNPQRQIEPPILVDLLSEKRNNSLSYFDESQIIPASWRNKRFFHPCHLIEVPPITFEAQESKGFIHRFHQCAGDMKQRFFAMLNTQ